MNWQVPLENCGTCYSEEAPMMKMNAPKHTRTYLIVFGLGIAIVLAGYVYLYPTHFSPQAQTARNMGVDPAAYVDSNRILKGVEKGKKLTGDDYSRIVALTNYHSHNNVGWTIRVRAVEALAGAAGTPNASAATSLTEKMLNAKSANVRQRAIATVWRLNPQDGRVAANKALQDPNPYVRRMAHLLLTGLKLRPEGSR
jgi:hypothetical protein